MFFESVLRKVDRISTIAMRETVSDCTEGVLPGKNNSIIFLKGQLHHTSL